MFEEHQSLVFELAKLELRFLWHWLRKHPEEKFTDAIRERVDLYRKTDCHAVDVDLASRDFSRPDWITNESILAEIYQRFRDDSEAGQFTEQGFLLLRDSLKAFAESTFGSREMLKSYQCGSLKYDIPKEGSRTVFFHIANAVAPNSFFSDPDYLPACMMDLMEETEKKYQCDSLETSTWLNSLPKWLALFPEEWQNNMGPEEKDVRWHYGFWGQFISHRGTFNVKYAEILRETGEFPFWPRHSHCSFSELRRHLHSCPMGNKRIP